MTCRAKTYELALIALKRRDLQDEVKLLAGKMRQLARDVDLPVTVEIGDRAVLVKSQYPGYATGLPQTTVTELCRRDDAG